MNDIDQLRDDVRATAPEADPVFASRLERRVEAGFRLERKDREPRRINLWAPGIALACTALIAVLIASAPLDNGGDDDGDMGEGGSAAPMIAEKEADDSGASVEPPTPQVEALPAGANDGGHYLREGAPRTRSPRTRGRGGNRVVVQRTTLGLETGADEFQEVSDEILRVADDSGSIVQTSRVSERDGQAFARYDLRVPSSRLDETLADLTRLAHVTNRSASSQDITRAYVSATDRLDDARDQRDALLKALERADTETEAEAIRRQIRLARTRISIAQRDAEALERRADRSRVLVTLRSTGKRSDEGGAWTPGDAIDDAGRILEVATGVVVVTAAALLPVALLGLLAALGARTVRRRRREAALDSA